MRLVVGLGNPGREYAESRHNVGFRCVDELARRHGLTFGRRMFKAILASGRIAGQHVVLAKPQTYMNLSGEAVGPLLRFYGLPPAHLLVIYDDMDLPLGRLRLREQGSAGGHNGMRSIIVALGTEAFPRLRIGIGRPAGETATGADYVLGRFTRDEEAIVAAVIGRAADAVEAALSEGLAVAMNRYNG